MNNILSPDNLEVSLLKLESVEWLSPMANLIIFNNSALHYMAIIVVVFLVWFAASLVTWIIEHHASKITEKTENDLDDVVIQAVHHSITFILVLGAIYLGIRTLNVPSQVDDFTFKAVFVLFTLKITKELEGFVEYIIAQYFEPLARKQKGVIKTFVPPLLRFSKFVLWAIALLLIVHNLGFNINSLLAGLGIGGLAFALGAQETLANLFGSVSLLMDETFKIGDYISGDGHEGTVEAVGIRSTKIKTLDNSIVSIPNKILASSSVENITERKQYKVQQDFGFVYDTSLLMLKELVNGIEQILRRDRDTNKDTIRVTFNEFGESGLMIRVFYHITDVSTYARIMEIKQRINLKIKERVEKIGADMAFPTQTLHLENANDLFKTTTRRKAHK